MKRILVYTLMSVISLTASAQTFFQLIGRNTGTKTMWDGVPVATFGFATNLGQQPPIPGPQLEVIEGDSVIIDFWNVSQGAPHTIHLHGLDVDQANDGVPHLSFEVGHMDHGYYRFKAPHPGTYLYHCHVASTIHVQAGMYGIIIVRPKSSPNFAWDGGPWFHRDRAFVLSEIDTFWHQDSVLKHKYDTTKHVPKVRIPSTYTPQYFLVNGKSEHELEDSQTALFLEKGERIYLRFVNVGYTGQLIRLPAALNSSIIASDGRALPAADNVDTLLILPGERYGVMLTPNQDLIDSIRVGYFNLNTFATLNTQRIPVEVSGVTSTSKMKPGKPLVISPNPASSKVALSSQVVPDGPTLVAVHAIDGRRMIEAMVRFQLGKADLDISGLPAGGYIIQCGSQSAYLIRL